MYPNKVKVCNPEIQYTSHPMEESHHTYEWSMSYVWRSHATLTYVAAWVTSQVWMSHVKHRNESYHTYELWCVMSWASAEIFFCCCFAATQLVRQLHQERSQVVCINRAALKRPARGHSRTGPWNLRHTHTHVYTKKRYRTKHTSTDTQQQWKHPPKTAVEFLILIADSESL